MMMNSPQNQFVVQEIMNEGISIALNAHGLQGAEGEGTEAEIQTDMEELLKVRITRLRANLLLFM